MELEEVLILINNLDMREPLRRYGPKWSTIAVRRGGGGILGVYRHKGEISIDLAYQDVALNQPGAPFFIATPGEYTTREDLERKLQGFRELAELDEEMKANPHRRWFGKTLVIRHSRDK